MRLRAFAQCVRSGEKRAKIGLVRVHTNRRLINGNKVSFLVQWNLRDTTWEPYSKCKELEALDRYLELLGIDDDDWRKLPRKASEVRERLGKHPNIEQPARWDARRR